MAENPFMSAYLGAANRAANTARGKATNEARIETAGDKHDQRLAERRAARTGCGWYLGRRSPRCRRSPAVIAHYTAEAAAEQAGPDRQRHPPSPT